MKHWIIDGFCGLVSLLMAALLGFAGDFHASLLFVLLAKLCFLGSQIHLLSGKK